MDPTYPAPRLEFMLEDSNCPILLTEASLLDRFATIGALRVSLDSEWETIARESVSNPEPTAGLENLAYVIYTSGSTGAPKGAMISHRGLVNYLDWGASYYRTSAANGAALHSSISFDLTVTSLFCPLLLGQSVSILPETPTALADELRSGREHGLLKITPAHLDLLRYELAESEIAGRASVLIVGGEALAVDAVSHFRRCSPRTRIVNEYGPTETVVGCSVHEVPAEGEIAAALPIVPIGRPIANARLYVLDRELNPVPPGVPGELFIGGPGVARGYGNRPDLTAERFIPDPYVEKESGARLYRTGDLARYRRDGTLDFLGRIDHQVKVRGYRIEPGEVESVLKEHPAVRDAAVVVREDRGDDRRLIGYLVLATEDQGSEARFREWREKQVSQWQLLYEDTYGKDGSALPPDSNFVGWNSSTTGEPIPEVEMREWAESTVGRIRALSPSKVLEIGCGAGLLLSRLAPRCAEYLATDFASVTLRNLEREVKLPQVRLLHRRADDFEGVAERRFDTAIVNSVIQYFPGVSYLLAVLERAVAAVADGGSLFVGDVRSLPLLEAYRFEVELERASSDEPAAEIASRVRKQMAQEEELVLNPRFFHALAARIPRIREVRILLKRGRYRNELNKYRYDVVLGVGASVKGARSAGEPVRLDWQKQKLTLESLSRLVRETEPEILEVARIPNARVLGEVEVLRRLTRDEDGTTRASALKREVKARGTAGVEPDDVFRLEESLPYSIELTWSDRDDDGSMSARFRHRESDSAFPDTQVISVESPA
ncbi:MAG: amino acid adenylation domain-containing protein, partial [Vicinamibacteria bacterium]